MLRAARNQQDVPGKAGKDRTINKWHTFTFSAPAESPRDAINHANKLSTASCRIS